ncbi:SVEP1 [Scenedesmus sp. PABB004]|nr:SVEP1 [Scenedesmus sp. PABB004]
MRAWALWALLLAVPLAAAAPTGSRALAQAPRGVQGTPSCRLLVPGCGVEDCTLTVVGWRSIPSCPRCASRLYVRSEDGTRCDCAAGAFTNCTDTAEPSTCLCSRCPTDSWCGGGLNAPGQATAVPCGTGRTTRAGVVARSISACVLLPGWGWPSRDAAGPALCPFGTYSTGWRAARTPCNRCPSGYTTQSAGSTAREQCVAAPGLFVDLGLVRPCRAGTYQPAYTMDGLAACTPCATGVTTATAAAVRAADCAVAQPGYGLTTCSNVTGCQAAQCSVGTYNPGGPGSSSCLACPWGLTTASAGAEDESLCRVPPGFGLVFPLPANRSVNATERCDFGYNPGWNRQACTSCGLNVTALFNRTSAADCYVLRGQGLQVVVQDDGTRVRAAVNCWAGSVGMPAPTPASSALPCDTCPRFMSTLLELSTNRSADCQALPGYTPVVGAATIQAVACAVGTYKANFSNAACTPCPSFTSTPGVASTSAANCTVCAAGYGGWSAVGPACTPCAVGTVNSGGSSSCTSCPSFTSTPGIGSTSTANCTVCAAGYGGWSAVGPACTPCAVGTVNNGSSSSCTSCPSFTSTPGIGSTSTANCTVCAAGYGGWSAVGPACTPCAVGTVNSGGSSSCTSCPSFTSTPGIGSTSTANCTVCAAGYGGWSAVGPACTPCAAGTVNNGSSSSCTACPGGQVAVNTTTCSLLLPDVSTCTPRPAASSALPAGLTCPGGQNNLQLTAAGNSYGLPPGCTPMPNNINNLDCSVSPGQWENSVSYTLTVLNISGTLRCVCPGLYTQGHMLVNVAAGVPGIFNPAGNKWNCVPLLTFLPDNASQPTGAGVWLFNASTTADARCNSTQGCWDMCFFCDGSRRYSANTCTLGSATTAVRPFWQACEEYAGRATPEVQGNLALVGGTWPFRPANSNTTTLRLPQALPSPLTSLHERSAALAAAGAWPHRSAAAAAAAARRLYVRSEDGTRCDCAAGAFTNCTDTAEPSTCLCSRCPTDSWCGGGLNAPGQATAVPCGTGRTTRAGVVARSISACVLLPGWGWPSRDAAGPALCPFGTYSTGWRAARTPCNRCPSGYTTQSAGSTAREQCVAAPGLFVDLGLVRPCRAGTYQPAYTMDGLAACTPCATGVTTATAAAVRAADCAVAQPGYGLTTCSNVTGCQAAQCSVGTYNPGGPGSSSCLACPWGLTTASAGAEDESLCRVPPGFGLVFPLPANRSVNATERCDFGYNPGWNRQACTSCGLNVTALFNRTSAADCYVLRGQGLQVVVQDDGTRVRAAVNCWAGSVGMPAPTPASSALPCDTCPRFMSTLLELSTNRSADCQALPGYTPVVGAATIQAVACAVGTYKANFSNAACTPCPSFTSTPGVASTSAANCTVCAAGYGGWSAVGPACTPCAVGTVNSGGSSSCTSCPSFTSTPGIGSTSTANCTVCAAGYGGWSAVGPACTPCAVGTVNSGGSSSCTSCPSFTSTPGIGSTSTANCTVCAAGYGGWSAVGPACTPCAAGTVNNGSSSSCTSCPSFTSTPGIGSTSTANCTVCAAGYGGWSAVGPACTPCAAGTVNNGSSSSCTACPGGQGDMIIPVTNAGVFNPNGTENKFVCRPLLTFLPNNASQPTGAGVWLFNASTTADARCNSTQGCWDMCFFCDGSRRYSANTCTLGSATTAVRPFWQACEEYAGRATPEVQGNLALVGGTWPFRPANSNTTTLRLPQALPSPLTVNQGQVVLQSFSIP